MGSSRGLPDNIPSLVKASGTTVTLASTYNGQPTRVTIGGQQYRVTSTLTLNTATTGLGGLDAGSLAANTLYYVYACVNSSGTIGLVGSTVAPTTGPSGFSGRYKLLGRFRTNYGSAAINTVAIDASIQPQGAVVGEWLPATTNPTLSFGSGTMITPVITCKTRRTGDSLDFQCAVTPTISGSNTFDDFYIGLPNDLTIDSTKLSTTSSNESGFVGRIYIEKSSAADWVGYAIYQSSGNKIRLFVETASGSYVAPAGITATVPVDTTAGNAVVYNIQITNIPVSEWAGLYT